MDVVGRQSNITIYLDETTEFDVHNKKTACHRVLFCYLLQSPTVPNIHPECSCLEA